MKYLLIGAGGVSGCLGGLLLKKGHDVTLMVRGATRKAIEKDGLKVRSGIEGDFVVHPKLYEKDDTPDKFDVIIVGVKGYSLREVIPFIDAASNAETAIIPFLNVLTAGDTLRAAMPDKMIVDGVIYIAAEKDGPGCVSHLGKVFRFYIGTPKGQRGNQTRVAQIADDILACGAIGGVSEDIRKDKIYKYSMISSMATTQIYYDIDTGPLQKTTECRVMFAEISREVQAMAHAQGVSLEEDLAERNLRLIMDFDPKTTASTYRDFKAGGANEVSDIVFEVVRQSRKFGFGAPAYELAAEKLGFTE